jgi:hypothetical protein
MVEAASTSETSVSFYRATRRYNPEDGHLHTRLSKNLKYHSEVNACNFNTSVSVVYGVIYILQYHIQPEVFVDVERLTSTDRPRQFREKVQ